EIEVGPREARAGRALCGLVVDDDQVAVAREVHVHLERAHAVLDRTLKRRQRVLRALGGRAAMRVEPPRVHHFSSSRSSASVGIGGGRGSLTWMTSSEYLMSFSASGWTRRTSTSSPDTFAICKITFIFALSSLAATSLSPTVSLASFGNSDRFIFL